MKYLEKNMKKLELSEENQRIVNMIYCKIKLIRSFFIKGNSFGK